MTLPRKLQTIWVSNLSLFPNPTLLMSHIGSSVISTKSIYQTINIPFHEKFSTSQSNDSMNGNFCSHEHKSHLRIELLLGTKIQENGERMGNDILEGILRLVNTHLLILLIKYITQVTEKCIHNAGVGGSSPPVATTSFSVKSIS